MKKFNGNFLILLALLGGSLAVLCHQGFQPYQVMWGNDAPLGAVAESSSRPPGSFFGSWMDFYWIGWPNPGYPISLTNICLAILGPAYHLKCIVPLSMFFLGFGAWFFFRQLRFSRMACVLGGLGAGLNMHYFSNGCWGVYNWTVCAGMIFIALGILVSPNIRPLWLKGVLAGFAVGVAVMDGYDVGAIMSVYVGVFLAFYFLTAPEPPGRRVGHFALAGALVVLCAALISLSDIYTLILTQVKGTATENQTEADKQAAWIFNTQFSIPKLETLRVIIPGLMGYRMQDYSTSTNPSAYYWGRVAEDPRIDDLGSGNPSVRTNAAAQMHLPDQVVGILGGDDAPLRRQVVGQVVDYFHMQRRHTGNGEYAGVLVCLLAVFGLVNSWRRASSPYSTQERQAVWFWGGTALFSLLVAWGRHAFLYAYVYKVPLISSFRNPEKYMHPFNICLMILAGYGLEAVCRRYMAAPAGQPEPFLRQLGAWWKRVAGFEKWWAAGCAFALAAAVAGYLILSSSKPDLVNYVASNGFDAAVAPQIAAFCVSEVGWFVVYFALSIGVLLCIMGGLWAGRRAVWAWIFLSAIMICDLSRADSPWIRYYSYKQKLSLNPVTDLLRQKPWEYRVDSRVWPSPAGGYLTPQLTGLCHWWLENDYPFNDIQCLEIDQAPRMPLLDNNYLNAFFVSAVADLHLATRLWQLSNTRYIFSDTNVAGMLNQYGYPKNSFQAVMHMNLVVKPGVTQPEDNGDYTVQTNSDGPVVLLEFTHALPRTKLYSNWKIVEETNALRQLRSPEFDPEKTVLVDKDTPVPGVPGSSEADPGTADISHYQSKDLVLEADAKTPAVLLLNDRTGDFWNVWVDQKPATMLRCNYIMRGVFVPVGRHTVEFRYQPPLKLLYVTLSAFALGILLAGYVIVTNRRREPEAAGESEKLE